MIQIVYVIMNEDSRYFNGFDIYGCYMWATYFQDAKLFTNRPLAEKANKTVGKTIYKIRISQEK